MNLLHSECKQQTLDLAAKSNLDSHFSSGHDVGDDVLRRGVRVHAVGPLANRHNIATFLVDQFLV
jgi:hypothetical protein